MESLQKANILEDVIKQSCHRCNIYRSDTRAPVTVHSAEQEHQWPASKPVPEGPIKHTTLQHQATMNNNGDHNC